MGRSHSKASKSPTTIINEKAPLSPRLKLKKGHEKKKQKKFGFIKKKNQLGNLKMPLAPSEINLSESGNDVEIEIKKRMQNQLAFNSDIFVLNQMMMSVQFFANYERFELCLLYLIDFLGIPQLPFFIVLHHQSKFSVHLSSQSIELPVQFFDIQVWSNCFIFMTLSFD